MARRNKPNLIFLIILIFTFGGIAPAFSQTSSPDSFHTTVKAPSQKCSLFQLVFEKEEEDKNGFILKNNSIAVELADFSRLPFLLSQAHTPEVNFISFYHQFDSHPPLFNLFCVFLI